MQLMIGHGLGLKEGNFCRNNREGEEQEKAKSLCLLKWCFITY